MSFSPLNLYTFAAARGQFLRPDVQALLRNAPVGLYSDFAGSRDMGSAARLQVDPFDLDEADMTVPGGRLD